jgi:hypothetical protein
MKFLSIRQLLDRHPIALGLGITGTLLLGLLIQTIVLDRFPVIFGPEGSPDNFRIAVNQRKLLQTGRICDILSKIKLAAVRGASRTR